MRRVSLIAAKLLGSNALRYRHALERRSERTVSAGVAAPRREVLVSRPAVAVAPRLGETQREPALAAIEAILLISREPLNLRKIAQAARLADATEARTLIRRLNRLYDLGGSAFRVEEVAGGFRLLTRRKFAGWLRRLHQSSVEVRLSSPALETLAVVAYRQPALRAAVETVRGVQCGEILRQLMERDLVRIVGRSEELGRPFLYGTTTRFLQVFGLRDLDELPRADYLRANSPAAPDEQLTELESQEESSDVSIVAMKSADSVTLAEEERRRLIAGETAQADADEDFEEEEDEGLDDDEDDDDDDEDDDEEDEDDEEFDDDFDDDDWEEVDEEDDDEEDDDEEDDDLDDDEDDDDDEDWEEDDEDEGDDKASPGEPE